MDKFHINAKGDAGRCSAISRCPFGDDEAHFSNAEDAREHYEATQAVGLLAKLKQRKFLRGSVTAGAMTLVAISLVGCSSISTGENLAGPYNSPDLPVASEPLAEDPSADQLTDELDKLYEEGKEWVDNNGPGLIDRAQGAWDKYGAPYLDESSPSPADTSGIFWQGGSLTPSAEEVAEAQRTLDSLVVQTENGAGYDRDAQFGKSFNTGMAGAVERRDVPTATFRNDSPQARIVDGFFTDPYTGEQVHVIGGQSYDADIDHLVPLSEAYGSGASSWTKAQGVAFANDMNNLVYTASGVNRSKGDDDAGEWLPSYEPAQCIYVISQIQIKGQYKLSVDTAEKVAMQQIINTRCS